MLAGTKGRDAVAACPHSELLSCTYVLNPRCILSGVSMKKQYLYYKHKLAKFEYRAEPEKNNSNLSSIKKLLSTGTKSDWNEAVNIFKEILAVRFVPANLNVSQSDTPFKDIEDWQDEIDADNVDIKGFGWDDHDDLPWATYVATFELPVNPVFVTNEDLAEWQENNDYLDVAFTADLEDDDLEGFCSSDEGASLYIKDES